MEASGGYMTYVLFSVCFRLYVSGVTDFTDIKEGWTALKSSLTLDWDLKMNACLFVSVL